MNIEKEVTNIVRNTLKLRDTDVIDIREDLSLYGLDSINCIGILVAIEERYNILIPEELLGMQNMHSIYDICELVKVVLNNERL